MKKEFKKYISPNSFFDEDIKENNVTWLKPELVAEIQYTELTKVKLLRQPSFKGLRKDKKATDVNLEVEK